MVIAWQRNAARWRESQKTGDNCEGRYSVRGFVSGGVGVLLAHASQGQITATHQTLGAGQKVANLCAKLTIGCPSLSHGVSAEQRSGNVAMVSARLRRIERLQGVQVQ